MIQALEIAPYKTSPIFMWTEGVQVEEKARLQLENLARMPFIFKHVAAMPDVHWGMGATVGSVIATKHAIIPAAVGVDIGCGMMAVQTNVHSSFLRDKDLPALRSAIEASVPHGRSHNGGPGDCGAWGSTDIKASTIPSLVTRLQAITTKHPQLQRIEGRAALHLGTLGTGNHFIEICLDENEDMWVMLHSGSRGPGAAIGNYFISKAKEDMVRWHIDLPDKDLAYIPQDTPLFKDYFEALQWAQEFALENRRHMMQAVLSALSAQLGVVVQAYATDAVINCHHNYAVFERHFGENVIVTRKGAVRARESDLGIIPGSMGDKSYIVRGKGNKDSFHSCSHGAGRAMSRTDARKKFTLENHAHATAGVECKKDNSVLDETPGAYKPIDAVMAAQVDLVYIVHTLRQVICVKG